MWAFIWWQTMDDLIYICIYIFAVFISSVSQILLKKSAVKERQNWLIEYLNPMVILAYFLFFSSTLITIISYKVLPLSLGPVLESSGYLFVMVLSLSFLKEKFSKRKIVGITLIVIGITVFTIFK